MLAVDGNLGQGAGRVLAAWGAAAGRQLAGRGRRQAGEPCRPAESCRGSAARAVVLARSACCLDAAAAASSGPQQHILRGGTGASRLPCTAAVR